MSDIPKFADAKFNVIMTHGFCPDGTCAAWAILHAMDMVDYKDRTAAGIELHFLKYGQSLTFPDITGKRAIMLDFAPPREQAELMHEQAELFVILDHHDSHRESLEGLDYAHFDMKRAGCQLAWDYVNDELMSESPPTRPWFIDYIADRDLWTWKLPDSKAINKAISLDRLTTFDNLSRLINMEYDEECRTINSLTIKGQSTIDYEKWLIDGIVSTGEVVTFYCNDGNEYTAFLCNSNVKCNSEVGNVIAESRPELDFAILFRLNVPTQDYYFSLRARQDSDINLSKICAPHGGGGHPKASGFEIRASEDMFRSESNPTGLFKVIPSKKL